MVERMVWMSVSEAADALGGDAATVFEAVSKGKLERAPREPGKPIQVRFPQRDTYNDEVHRG